MNIKLSPEFKTKTPVLPNVKIIDTWAYYDGPLFGLCEINGRELFFMTVVYDIWRYYTDDTDQRLWRIYGVYDIDVEDVNKIINSAEEGEGWHHEINDRSDCIGIFWEYDKDIKDKGK